MRVLSVYFEGHGAEPRTALLRLSPIRTPPPRAVVCVECLIGKQKKPIIFKVTEPSVPVILYEITAIPAHVSRGEEHSPFKKGF